MLLLMCYNGQMCTRKKKMRKTGYFRLCALVFRYTPECMHFWKVIRIRVVLVHLLHWGLIK